MRVPTIYGLTKGLAMENDDTRIVRVIFDISVALAKQCAAHDKDAEEICSKLLKLAINEALRLHNDNNDNGQR